MTKQKKNKQSKSVSPEMYQLLLRGTALFDAGELQQAEQVFLTVLQQDAKNPDANYLLGIIANRFGQNEVALKRLQKAIKVSPKVSQIYTNLGIVLKELGQLTKAIQNFNKAILLSPKNGSAYNNLAGCYQDQGKLLEADQAYAKAVQYGFFPAYSNRLLLTNYRIDIDQAVVLDMHQKWDAFYLTQALENTKNYTFSKPKGRIRLGYVSPDFNAHSVSYFFEPLLDHYDKSKFEVYCYYASSHIDDTTRRLQEKADHWRSLVKLKDKQAADLIFQDKIDILVDMTGHTGINRLGIFTYQAAPIQMTWLGYPNTTGLTAMQYRITDEIADPADDNAYCSEQVLRLPSGFLSYKGNANVAPNPISPCQTNGYFTFGSFNNLRKVNEEVIAAWSAILKSTPNSRLLIKSKQFAFVEVKQRFLKLFKAQGVPANRLILRDRIENQEAHLKLYDEVDLALDTFPYNGTTTTCEALWMGVPTLTYTGKLHAARVSASILKHANLDDFIANDLNDYIDKAQYFAENTEALSALRPTIRATLLASELCNAKGFTKNMEQAFLSAIERLI